nr:hypothetical protein [Anaerolineae bacterium]
MIPRQWLWMVCGLVCTLSAVGCRQDDTDFLQTEPRPTVVVITIEGPYNADFDQPGDWLVGRGEHSHGVVKDGRYVLSITEPEFLAWTHQQRAFGDGIYQVDTRLLSGPEASAFGLLLLGTSNLSQFYYCLITGDGRYDIGYCEDGCRAQESLVGGFTLAYPILPGNNTNSLRIDLFSGQMTVYINGTPVSQLSGLEYEPGLVGFIGESSPYGGFQVAFDNLLVSNQDGQ